MQNQKLFRPIFSEDVLKNVTSAQNGSVEALETVIKECSYLIENIADDFENNHLYDDLYSIGLEALYEVILKYDINSNGKTFLSYAREKIYAAISNYWHDSLKYKQMINLNSLSESETSEYNLFSILEEEYLIQERNNIIRDIINQMPEEWQYIVIHRFGFDNEDILTFQEIADRLEIPKSTVNSYYRRILNHISVELKAEKMFALTKEEARETYYIVRDRKLVKETRRYNYNL